MEKSIKERTIVMVLKSGGDFNFQDVFLLVHHIKKHASDVNVICISDKFDKVWQLDQVTIIPMKDKYTGWWSKLNLFSPELKSYRPFLFMDLDTAVVRNFDSLFPAEEHIDKFIAVEDFYQKSKLQSCLLWVPANNNKIDRIYNARNDKRVGTKQRMDYFLRDIAPQDLFFQQITNEISSFKPYQAEKLKELPADVSVVCFHGKPRIHEAIQYKWVSNYIKQR